MSRRPNSGGGINCDPGSGVIIVAAAPDASCTSPYHAYEWGSASGDPYGAGASFAKPSGMGWTQQGTYDFTFRTFVATPQGSIPQGTPTGQRAAALASCKKRAHKHNWSHKRLRKCKKKANLLPV